MIGQERYRYQRATRMRSRPSPRARSFNQRVGTSRQVTRPTSRSPSNWLMCTVNACFRNSGGMRTHDSLRSARMCSDRIFRRRDSK